MIADLPFYSFESMLQYDDEITRRMLETLSVVLDRNKEDILEDFGTYIVTDKRMSSIQRLLRFGGETYAEFLLSLEDVHARLKVAMPMLEVPKLALELRSKDRFVVHYEFTYPGYGCVLLGLLRAMADDYGALVTIEHDSKHKGPIDRDRFEIKLHDAQWKQRAEIRRLVG